MLKLRQLEASRRERALMGCWTWAAMSGNGCTMPLLRSIRSTQPSKITMRFHRQSTRWALTRLLRNIAVCAAVHGIGHLVMAVLLIAYGSEKMIIMTRLVFVARFLNK